MPFEINVSVSLGGGLSYAEGGGLENTVGQAFLRDPDGYYFEICNCHLLTDFVLGNETNFNPDVYKEDNDHADRQETLKLTWFFFSKLAALANRAKKNVAERKKSDPTQKVNYISPLPRDKQPQEPDATILENFIQRKKIYSSICQSFSDEEIKEILLQSGNNAPAAILLMKQKIDNREIIRIYQPHAYFVSDIDDDLLFKPNALVAGADEKGKDHEAPELTAGETAMQHDDDADEDDDFFKSRRYIDDDQLFKSNALVAGADEKGKDHEAPELTAGDTAMRHDDDADEDDDFFKSRRFKITEVNHIGLIVSDVGKATDFCADVLGLQQVKRPNFDRHGAWFTGGNLEMHLIKGNPLVPKRSTKGSEANSVSLMVIDLAAAKEVLAEKYAADESIMLEVEDDACHVRDPDGYVYKVHA